MKHPYTSLRHLFAGLAIAGALSATPLTSVADNAYIRHNLVSDGFVPATYTDANLVNAWGVAFNPFGPVWVADAGTGVSTLYDGAGYPIYLVVVIPGPAGSSAQSSPTGTVYNGSSDFVVSNGTTSAASRFIFATEEGVIAGWAPTVDTTYAIRVVDKSSSGAIYKGLAVSAGGNGSLLYAADFHNNRIDVFDSAFQSVTLKAGAFTDPGMPAGYAPFGLQAINGDIYVAYAKQDAEQRDEIAGPSLGFVAVFDPNGQFIHRLIKRGKLNAPWGMALAPAGFGSFGNRLLVGNFGDGRINAFDIATGEFVGTLSAPNGKPIHISGLWGIAFGNGYLGQPNNTLFFAAGPGNEKHGLYGRIDRALGH